MRPGPAPGAPCAPPAPPPRSPPPPNPPRPPPHCPRHTPPRTTPPALPAGGTAVVPGAASGIGLAAAKRFAGLGLHVCLADLPGAALDEAARAVGAIASSSGARTLAVPTDVARMEEMRRLKDAAYGEFGEVGILMNNAAITGGAGPWEK